VIGACGDSRANSDDQWYQQVQGEHSNGRYAQEVNFYVANTHVGDFREIEGPGEGSNFYMLIAFGYKKLICTF
jgi:hypothetical protein